MSKKAATVSKVEGDVQKFRDDSNWKKVIELGEQFKGKTNNEQLMTFLLGEAKLELYLEENPPYDHNIAKAKTSLSEAKSLLETGAKEKGLTASIDANLLLGKLHFACGEYEDSLSRLTEAGIEQLAEKSLPARSLRIIAESFAVYALCLEKLPAVSTSKYKISERDQKVLKYLEMAGDLGLLCFQEQDKLQGQSSWSIATSGSNSPLPSSNEHRVGLLLETALLRVPLMHIKAGRWPEAIARYRAVLTAVETSATQNLRITFARQLAEILLRSVSQANYVAVQKSTNEGLWKPRRYVGSSLFTPKTVNEEIILLLLISEAMAVRDAVLSQSPEFREARKTAMRNAVAVYDLLAVCLTHHDQTNLLSESLERALKFSFEDSHIWTQLALSLASAGKHSKAVLVLKEVIRLNPSNPLPCLMAARICMEHLNLVDDALELAEQAVQRGISEGSRLTSRALLYCGIACFVKWRQSRIQSAEQQWSVKALEYFRRAEEHDTYDHLVHFYMAMVLALRRDIPQALARINMALRQRSEHLPSLLLLALLVSTPAGFAAEHGHHGDSTNSCEAALALVEATLEEYPENFDLLYVKALLEEQALGGEAALVTTMQMLSIWKQLYEDQSQNSSEHNPYATIHQNTFDTRSLALSTISAHQHLNNEVSDRDTGSVYAQSVAAARAEQALSDVNSSLSSYIIKSGPQKALYLQLKIWLLIGELYVRLGRPEEAAACVQEAVALSPVSHQVMYLRGLIHESKNEFADAKVFYENAIALSPFHVPSLQHLGMVFHYLGSHRLGEKTLRDALRIDLSGEQTWFNLGQILESMGEHEGASECMARALEIQVTSPVVPFTSVPLCFE